MPGHTEAAAGEGVRKRRGKDRAEGAAEGEADQVTGHRFQAAERSLAENAPARKKARQTAEALEGPDGPEPQQARRQTGAGKLSSRYVKSDDTASADPHTDENLDHGLDETFPASDPVSISPGAD